MADRFSAAASGLRVPDWLRQRAQVTPNRLALVFEEAGWTFAELDRGVDAAVEVLRGRGVEAGERIGLLAANGPGFVHAVHALMRIGAVLVPINTRLTPSEIEWQVQDAEVALVLGDDDVRRLAEPRQGVKVDQVERQFDVEAWHSIIYTSGTTGRPKGAILTYANHWWSAVASALNLGLRTDDVWLACLPLYHVGGLSILLRSVIYGITAVVQSRFDAAEVNLAIDSQGVSIVSV